MSMQSISSEEGPAAAAGPVPHPGGPFDGYRPLPRTYDEVFDEDGRPHPALVEVVDAFAKMDRPEFRRLQKLASNSFLRGGVTFSVYATGSGDPDRIFPFDVIPRVVVRSEWERVERGLVQRIAALNAFLCDVYGD